MKAKNIDELVTEVTDDFDLTVLTLEQTGNGYIAHFPSSSSASQDNYVCLNYAEASYLYAAMKKIKKELK